MRANATKQHLHLSRPTANASRSVIHRTWYALTPINRSRILTEALSVQVQPAEGITKHQQASSARGNFHTREFFSRLWWDGYDAASLKLCMLKPQQKSRVPQHFGALYFKGWEVKAHARVNVTSRCEWGNTSYNTLVFFFFWSLTVRLFWVQLKETKWQIHQYITESTWTVIFFFFCTWRPAT